ncbi:DNA starvation/stationary phase protection protein [Hymenobacter ginsengisoli]|uniref:DNA starvation/stationary phase protection protein n=1 Tax=Hymenobacter ginsengisoli TaxID=1051626 RepID=A0ABP8PY68_9BACT|nr:MULTISPECIES: DNA starvation/stationary phase protection protein [unclassified Hymenobacter]MBO2030572.1 DNA starvation/stationary phase protection protein [Hymenobacter sp. BT559]
MPATQEKLAKPTLLHTPSDLDEQGRAKLSDSLNLLVSDLFALYLKTKNYHWHMSGRHFRDYHLLLDEQADQIFAITDEVAERVRKLGYPTIHSIGEISRKQRVKDNDDVFENPLDMLIDLQNENRELVKNMRETHEIADDIKDVATASLLEVYIDQAERRAWFLFEASREVN